MAEQMSDYQLLMRMGLILLLGFLVGIERGWSLREKKAGKRTAGIRTFTLIALAGGLWGILSEHIGDVILGFALLGFVIIIMVGFYQQAKLTNSVGLTTEMAAFVTFAIGVAGVKGYILLSVAVTIIMVGILSIKPRLHRWVTTIEPNELYSGILFLVISAVLLPLLPNQGYGPWNVLNPFEIWAMVVLIAGVSYVGYFSMKYLGGEKGILFTAFTGSLVSSIAVTVTLGRYSQEMKSIHILITGLFIATLTALGRVLLWIAIFNPPLLVKAGPPVLLMIAITLAGSVWLWGESDEASTTKKINVSNPLQMGTALQFGVLLVIIMLLSETSKQWFGDPGIFVLSVISGMVDIDSITLSLLQMGGEALSQTSAAKGVVLAAITNTLVKGGIFVFFAGFGRVWKALLLLSIIAAFGFIGVLLFA